MTEQFILQLIWSILLFILGIFGIYCFAIRDKYKKLREESLNIRRSMNLLAGNPREIVGKGLGNIGIEGMLDELGVDVGILNNPMVKGLIAKYAPRVIEQMSKGKGQENKEGSYSL